MRGLVSLILIGALAYGGLYLYYGIAIERAIDARLEDFGASALTVQNVRYGPLAPVTTQASVTATLAYRGNEAALTVRVDGHPLLDDDLALDLEGLRALRFLIGADD